MPCIFYANTLINKLLLLYCCCNNITFLPLAAGQQDPTETEGLEKVYPFLLVCVLLPLLSS